MDIFGEAFRLEGVEGVEKMAEIVKKYSEPGSMEQEHVRMVERSRELIKLHDAQLPESRNDDVMCLAYTVALTQEKGNIMMSTLVLRAALAAACNAGLSDARLEVFKSAEVKEDADVG